MVDREPAGRCTPGPMNVGTASSSADRE